MTYRILIIEDDTAIQEGLKNLLMANGYEVGVIHDFGNVLQELAAVVVSAIVMIYFFTSISAQIDAYIGAAVLTEQVAAILSILVTLTVCYFAATWVLFRRSIRSSF